MVKLLMHGVRQESKRFLRRDDVVEFCVTTAAAAIESIALACLASNR